MQYLKNSQQIREQIAKLFSGTGKKWAVVGFVGLKALDHLPADVSDLSVVCWPHAGGTNPDGVRRLIDKGITVYFCDRLHQKIYWRQDIGLIVGSANLSENGLGDAGLHEFGVFCNDDKFDISGVLAKLKYAQVTPEALAKLDVEHTAQARQGNQSSEKDSRSSSTFLDALQTKIPKQWKFVTWSDWREDNSGIQAEVETHFGKKEWVKDNDVDSEGFESGDFVLQVRTNADGIVERANAEWLAVDHVVGKRGNRIIVQVNKLDCGPIPPFEIDSTFRKHLKQALNEADNWDYVYDEKHVIKPSFTRSIKALYTQKAKS